MEEEVIYLSAVTELLRSMVNFELMKVVGEGDHKQVRFETSVHRQFFFIALVDFLSRTDAKAPVPSVPYLRALKAICDAPCFDANNSVLSLKKAVNAFSAWLREEISIPAWLPSISLQVEFSIPRYTVLKIVGNLSKHNTLRSVGVAEDIQLHLQKAGKPVELYQAMLAQEDLYDIFHDDVCAYHGSTIVEFLNGLVWGIQNYLLPDYRRAYTPEGGDSLAYKFRCPEGLESPYAKTCYHNLMNRVRTGPIFEPFVVTEHLKIKGRY